MWMIADRPIRLTYGRGRLFRAGVSALTRRVLGHDTPDTGCPPFDQWSPSRKLGCLATVAQGLLSGGRPTTFASLWTDAAIAATLKQIEAAAEARTHFGPDLAVPWRQLIKKAYAEHHHRNAFWKGVRVPTRHAVRMFRSHWTTLDWQWIDTSPKEARDKWREEGYEVVINNDFARGMPDSFFFDPPPDPGPEETQQHERYLLGLGPGGGVSKTTAEPIPTTQTMARATRRVQL